MNDSHTTHREDMIVTVTSSYNELQNRVIELEKQLADNNVLLKNLSKNCSFDIETLNRLFESVDDQMTLMDRNYKIVWSNQSAKNVFGQDIVGRYCYDVFKGQATPCEPHECTTRRSFIDGNSHRQNMEIRVSEGDTVYLQDTSNVVSTDESGLPLLVVKVSKDISSDFQVNNEREINLQKLRKNLAGTIQAMAMTVETRDAYTAGHQRRATNIARAISQEMHLEDDQVDAIRMAGVIHDLGKISVPAEILSKPGEISDVEFSLIKKHPETGYNILKEIDFQWPIADIVLQHHERVDGSGYPNGLQGEDILLEAKIIGVADVIEAMASHRPYRPALGIKEAFEEITDKKGVCYDPAVVDAAVNLYEADWFDVYQ
jgi:PAS domain S-box-containing protein